MDAKELTEVNHELPPVERLYLYYDAPVAWWGAGKLCYLASTDDTGSEFFVGEVPYEEIEGKPAAETIKTYSTLVCKLAWGKYVWRDAKEDDFVRERLPHLDYVLELEWCKE
jgi:hypothetical protein